MKGKDIGTNLNNFRSKKGLTQLDLAKLLNVTAQTVSNWERGISMPDPNTICQICNILDVSSDELLGLKDEKKDQKPIEKSIEKPPVQSTVYYEYTATSATVLIYLYWITIAFATAFVFSKNAIVLNVVSILAIVSLFAMLICILLAKEKTKDGIAHMLLSVFVAIRCVIIVIIFLAPLWFYVYYVVFSIINIIANIGVYICLPLAYVKKDGLGGDKTVSWYIVLIIASLVAGVWSEGISLLLCVLAIIIMARSKKDRVYSGSYATNKSYYSEEVKESENIFKDHEVVENKKKLLEQEKKENPLVSIYKLKIKPVIDKFLNAIKGREFLLLIAIGILPLYILLQSVDYPYKNQIAVPTSYTVLPIVFYTIVFFNKKARLFFQISSYLAICFATVIMYFMLRNGSVHYKIPSYVPYVPYGLNLFAFLIYVWLYPEQKRLKIFTKICLSLIVMVGAVFCSARTSLFYYYEAYGKSTPALCIVSYLNLQLFVFEYLNHRKAKRGE